MFPFYIVESPLTQNVARKSALHYVMRKRARRGRFSFPLALIFATATCLSDHAQEAALLDTKDVRTYLPWLPWSANSLADAFMVVRCPEQRSVH